MTYSEEKLEKELKRRLDGYARLHKFVTDLAMWDATTDSWYDLFKSYQKRANDELDKVHKGID